VIIISADRFWPRLARVIGREDLGLDNALATNRGRSARSSEIYEAISNWTKDRVTEEALLALQAADVPAERIANIAQVVEDPHLRARGMFRTLPSSGELPVLASATGIETLVPQSVVGSVPSGAKRKHLARDAPGLGAHTIEVLTELGLLPEDIENMLRDRVAEDASWPAVSAAPGEV